MYEYLAQGFLLTRKNKRLLKSSGNACFVFRGGHRRAGTNIRAVRTPCRSRAGRKHDHADPRESIANPETLSRAADRV
jgi:hypothetical protein